MQIAITQNCHYAEWIVQKINVRVFRKQKLTLQKSNYAEQQNEL